MPAAAPVSAHPVQASAPSRAERGAKPGKVSAAGSASTPGTTSGGDFGQYFREQAGTVAPATPVTSPHGPEATAASGDHAPASAEPVPSLAGSGLAGSAPATKLPDSPQSLILELQGKGQLQGKPHGAADEVAAAEVAAGAQSGGETGPVATALDKASALDEGKVTKGSPSTKGAGQNEKADSVDPSKDAASSLPIVAMPPSAASPAVISPVPLLPLKPAVASYSGTTQPARAGANPQGVNTQKLTGGKVATPVSAAAENSPAAPPAPGAPDGVANQPPLPEPLTAALAGQISSGDGKQTSGTGSGDARAKGSSESSPAMPGPHAGQVAATPATAAPASLSALPAAAHSEAPSFPLPHVVASPPAAAPSAAGNPSPAGATVLYDRLDQAAAPVVLHSGAQHVSVGVHDPNLGWVEIQTQNSGGHVDAMLVASSGQTHDSLAAQLPAMAQFLAQRDVRVGTLAVQQQTQNQTGGGGTGGGMGSGTGYSGNGGAGGRYSGSANTGGERNAARSAGVPTARGRISGTVSGAGAATEAASLGEASPYRPLSYISVRA